VPVVAHLQGPELGLQSGDPVGLHADNDLAYPGSRSVGYTHDSIRTADIQSEMGDLCSYEHMGHLVVAQKCILSSIRVLPSLF
jgi:hypothetical protein